MAPLQCTNGHPLYKWKKARLWQGWVEEASCALCKVSLGRNDMRMTCGQKCAYRVCLACAKNANTPLLPPEIGAITMVGDSWGQLVAHTGHHIKGPLFKEYEGLLDAAKAEYVSTPGFRPGDVLLVVDVQNDFIPQDDAPLGGKFGVAEGADAAKLIVQLIDAAASKGAKIVGTRDYHPKNHCSFSHNGGPFPAHCIQGLPGSFFFPPVEQALLKAREFGADVSVVFKGFAPGVESFGGFQYTREHFAERFDGLPYCDPEQAVCQCCAVDWTGCFVLECSGLDEDLNAPPDVMSVLSRRTMSDHVGTDCKRIFAVGLSLDFCVLDSVVNASAAGLASEGLFVIADATRAAHIPGIGPVGTGFLTPVEQVIGKLRKCGAKLTLASMMEN